ncbi:MAG TPA: hypothetical protein VFL28_16725 [bacterium]|nr:hypothetical protein [bacterium]
MRVVLDVDGVLADFILGFTTLANRMFGTPVFTTLEQKSWDAYEGISAAQCALALEAAAASPAFWQDLPPIASPDELAHLASIAPAHDLYFVTNRFGNGAKAQTETWLRRHGVSAPTVILSEAKGEVARAVRADVLLDDKAGNAVFTQYYSRATAVYLIDRPYNRFDPAVLGSKITRVRTLDEFFDRSGLR